MSAGAAAREDLWGPTIPCADCKAEVRWELLTAHWCPESERRIAEEIAVVEQRLEKLRTERDRLAATKTRSIRGS